jgi:hypothetical protein
MNNNNRKYFFYADDAAGNASVAFWINTHRAKRESEEDKIEKKNWQDDMKEMTVMLVHLVLYEPSICLIN